MSYPLVAVVGPTGSGKSDLALCLAQEFQGEIVNCDSIQLYRHFDIGAAKLPESARRSVPHHLIDVLDPNETFTAGEFARRGRAALSGIRARGLLPIVAGGTGFYLRALIDGLFAGPQRDEALRARLAARERRKRGSIHRLLNRFDRAAALAIHPNDVPKVIRALEVCLVTRRPLTEWFATGRDALEGFRILKIGLSPPREVLYERLDQRCQNMFESGLIDEVRSILDLGFSPTSKPFESLGYKQALQLIQGELSIEEAVYHASQATRRYSKRQLTWFRAGAAVEWISGFGHDAAIQADAIARVRRLLESVASER
ncbi:MAG: tRNA (adenosine(37)-N6)-dimethylallyltransferase MiaA [Bryobacteraceae bacterium]